MAIKTLLLVLYRWVKGHLEAALGFVLGAGLALLVGSRKSTKKPEDTKAEELERKVAVDMALHDAVKDPPYPVESLDEVRRSLRARGLLK